MEGKSKKNFGATTKTFELANSLRKDETIAEKYLWKLIRHRQLKDFKFRRQHPIALLLLIFIVMKPD